MDRLPLSAVMITLLIIGGGSVYFFTRIVQVQRYMGEISRAHPVTLSDALDVLAAAPAMICTESRLLRDGKEKIEAFFHAGLTRITILPSGDERDAVAVHAVLNREGMYAWYDDSNVVHHLDATQGEPTDVPGVLVGRSATEPLFNFSSCRVWWRPDSTLFQTPEDLLVTEGSLPR